MAAIFGDGSARAAALTSGMASLARSLADPVPRIDVLSFDEVYAANVVFVWRILRTFGVADAALEDAAQDVFVVVHRRLAEFEGRAAITTWLFAIARRVASGYRRRALGRPTEELVDDPVGSADTFAALSRAQAAATVMAILERMDEDKRVVFALVELEQMTVPAVASVLGINVNTAYSRLRHARAAFEAAVQARVKRVGGPMCPDELGPLARGLVEAARGGGGPDAAAIARVRARVAVTVGGAGAAGATATKLSMIAKLGAALVVAGAVVVGAYRMHDPAASIEPIAPVARGPAAAAAVTATPLPLPVTATVTPWPAAAPAPPVVAVSPRAVRPRPLAALRAAPPPPTAVAAAVAASPPPPPPPDLAREVALVDRATASLRAHDPRGALATVAIYRAETRGGGQLAEDAAAIELEALCRLRDPSAAAALAAFDARWPGSVERARAVAACAP